MERHVIGRRLISGIILGFMAFINLISGSILSTDGVAAGDEAVVTNGGDLLILGFANLLVAIVFIATCRSFPRKWLEYSVAIISTILELLAIKGINGVNAPIIWLDWLASIGFVALGLVWSKKGFPNMPYIDTVRAEQEEKLVHTAVHNALNDKEDAQRPKTASIVQPIQNQTEPQDYISEIQQLKKLFDSGVITQEEFNAKKSQLLNLPENKKEKSIPFKMQNAEPIVQIDPPVTPKAQMPAKPEDRNNGWWDLLGFLLPIVGWILWGVWHKDYPKRAHGICLWAWIGFGLTFGINFLVGFVEGLAGY